MFELDTLISNVLNGTDTYMSTNGGSSQAMVEPTNSAIAKEMNIALAMRSSTSSTSSAAASLAQNSSHSNSNSALRNDVKLSEYSEFAPCYAAMQQSHAQQQMQNNQHTTSNSAIGVAAANVNANSLHSASMSQPSHSQQSNSNDSNGHLSKMFGDDDTSMLMNNNNNKSIQNTEHSTHVGGQQQLPSTPQSGRIRNSLMSDYNFSPVNGILSLSNTSGEYSLASFCIFHFIWFCRFWTLSLVHTYHILNWRSINTFAYA